MRKPILCLLSAVGLLLSVHLTVRHVRFEAGGSAESGLCAIVAGSDCNRVEASRFSEIAGVPTASFGAAYFLVLLGFFALGNPRGTIRDAPGPYWTIGVALAWAGLLACAGLAWISWRWIGAFCADCVAVYAVCVGIAATTFPGGVGRWFAMGMRAPRDAWRVFASHATRPEIPGAKLRLRAAAVVALLLVPASFALPAIQIHRSRGSDALKKWLDAPVVEIPVGERAIVLGPEDAPLQIVVFTDFECPNCRKFVGTLKDALAAVPEQGFRVVYKHFPLGPACNELVKRLIEDKKLNWQHPKACELAAYAQALHDMDPAMFEQAYPRLYLADKKDDLNEHIRRIAADHEIDLAKWAARSKTDEVRRRVTDDVRAGTKLGILGVPAVFVNGRPASIERAKLDPVLRAAPRYAER